MLYTFVKLKRYISENKKGDAMKIPQLEIFYYERSSIIRRYLVKSGCSQEDAEDIVQETFCKAIEYMPELSTDHISAWLFRVAINHWRDLCRKNKKAPSVSIDVLELAENLKDESDGEFLFLQKEESQKIRDALERLTDVHKNLLLLKYDMDLSYEQIGVLLNMNETTVKTYLYRARKAFQKEWSDYDE